MQVASDLDTYITLKGGAKMGDLQNLYQLQLIELELEVLQNNLRSLPVFADFKQLKIESADAKETFGWADTKRAEHKKRVKRLETDLQQAEEEQKVALQELYEDSGQGVKELEQLEKRSESLSQERTKKEETLLAAMEGLDELEKASAEAKDSYHSIHETLLALHKSGNKEIKQLKTEMKKLERKANKLRKQIAEPLLQEYQEQRQRFHGRPLAIVENDVCTGCHVILFSVIKSKLNQPDCKVYCENCARLLVPIEEE